MLKTFVVLSFFCVSVSCGFCGEYAGGDGTADNPYQIASVEHLVELGKTQSDYGSHFILTADLDMAGTVYKRAIISPDSDDKKWGNQGNSFKGVFDGGGHAISRFSAENRSVQDLALFGHLGGKGVIKNLHIVDADVKGGNGVSCLAGTVGGSIENCSATGRLSGAHDVGGIAAYLYKASVKNSKCDVIISTYRKAITLNRVGGLVGSSQGGSVEDCFSKCSITSKGKIYSGGGAVGHNSGTITDSYCEGVRIESQLSGKSVGAFCGSSNGSTR